VFQSSHPFVIPASSLLGGGPSAQGAMDERTTEIRPRAALSIFTVRDTGSILCTLAAEWKSINPDSILKPRLPRRLAPLKLL
jgi:hypothetical protein